jgi:hypothetical protein
VDGGIRGERGTERSTAADKAPAKKMRERVKLVKDSKQLFLSGGVGIPQHT